MTMKRYHLQDSDFTNLYERYCQVSKSTQEHVVIDVLIQENDTSSSESSYPGIKTVKVFVQRPGQGADLMYLIHVVRVDSDNGSSGAVISGEGENNLFHITTTDKSAQVKVVDSKGMIENDFVTNIKPKFDSDNKELIIIHVEEL